MNNYNDFSKVLDLEVISAHPNYQEIDSEINLFIKLYKPQSIMLIGSYSRGDFWKDGIHESDVEFYIFLDPNEKIQTEFRFCDVSIIRRSRIGFLEKNLINFEAKESGLIVFGRDLRSSMPKVTVGNIDQGIVDEIILFRLLEIAKTILAKGDIDFAYTKNLSYLLAWSLIKDGKLLCGFNNRAKVLQKKIYLPLTRKCFPEVKLFEKLVSAREGIGEMPVGGREVLKIYEGFLAENLLKLFQERSLRGRISQYKYIIGNQTWSILDKIHLLFCSIFKNDYRLRVVRDLDGAIRSRDPRLLRSAVRSCHNYYPFLNER